MLMNEKIVLIRKLHHLSQEAFAQELGVSRQAVSKWENASAQPDIQMLLKIADFADISLDELVREELNPFGDVSKFGEEKQITLDIEEYVGKRCDVIMTSMLHNVLRNVLIVGFYQHMVCFIKNERIGWFNMDKTQGILVKDEAVVNRINELTLGKCHIYTNKGDRFFGSASYLFCYLEKVEGNLLTVRNGKSLVKIHLKDVTVIKMREKITQ